jgi:hypothetical protein
MWQSVGTPAEIINRAPYDWGPLYYLVMAPWQTLVGNHSQTARVLSVLWFALGSAFVYRAASRLRPGTMPLLAALIYATSSGILTLSFNIRGYALQLALLPLAFWLMQRYFDAPFRPKKIVTLLLLVVAMAAMIYIHPTGLLACALLGVYTLFAYPRRLWRWLPAALLLVIITFPQLQTRFGTAANRFEATSEISTSVDLTTLSKFFVYYAGSLVSQQIGWLVLGGLALALFLWRLRPSLRSKRPALPLLLTVIASFFMLLLLGARFGFGGERHGWWLMLPLALLLAWGLSYLPRPLYGVSFAIVLIGLFIFTPQPPLDESSRPNPPLGANFAWMVGHFRAGDVVVTDPNQQCTTFPDEWDYYMRLYFPQGLQIITEPADYQRVWYITADGWDDKTLKTSIQDGRIATVFNGPWSCLFRLYSAPPDADGVLYENGMRFHGYEIIEDGQPLRLPLVRREGEATTVRLWWSVDEAPPADYSVALHIYDEDGALVTQSDSAPQLIHLDPVDASTLAVETSRWQPDIYYVEERTLVLPDKIPYSPVGTHLFTLGLVVYQFWDNVRIDAPGLAADQARILQSLTVRSW